MEELLSMNGLMTRVFFDSFITAPGAKTEDVSKRLFGDGASSSDNKAGENYFAQFASKKDL